MSELAETNVPKLEVMDKIVIEMEPDSIHTFDVIVDSETDGVMSFVPTCGCTTINSINVVPGINIVRASISSKTAGTFNKKINWAFYKDNIIQTTGVVKIEQIVK